MKKRRQFISKKILFLVASLCVFLFLLFGSLVYKGKPRSVKFKININKTKEKNVLGKLIDEVNLLRRQKWSDHVPFGKNTTHSDSLIVTASYDLLSHPDGPNLHQILQAYLKNSGGSVSCKLRHVRPHTRMSSMKVTALVSYPRSGNTWLRTLVEKSTGYRTSSIYCDRYLYLFQSECNHQNPFLIKTHATDVHAATRGKLGYYDQFIHLVRNPFDVILSYYQFQNSSGDHTRKCQDVGGSVSSRKTQIKCELLSIEDVREMVGGWYNLYTNWEKSRLPRMIIRYEDLRHSPGIILRYLRRFLVPYKLESGQTDENGNLPVPLYYFDHPYIFSLKKEIMRKYVEAEDEKITCAVAENLQDQDIVYKSNKYESLYSLKYFSNETVTYIVRELRELLCYFKYDVLLVDKLNMACNHSLYANVPKISFQ